MNGIHDMGGMRGLGELHYEETEPVFHEPWEGRVPAMMAALGVFDGFRVGIEAIPAADYLRMSYYERWLVTLNEQIPDGNDPMDVDVLALHEALEELERLDQRQARVVELRFFGGLSIPEAAEVLGIGARTVQVDWSMARAWLTLQLRGAA